MSGNKGGTNLQKFLENFYRDDSTKIIENVSAKKIKPKSFEQKDDDELEEKPAPMYLFTRESFSYASDLNILDFPMEILIYIFTYLNPSDLRALSSTCRQFYEAMKYFKFTSHRTLCFNKITFSDWEPPVSDFNESSRIFHHVSLYLVHFPATSNYFWYVFGTFIRTLSLERCIIKKGKFIEMLRYCDNLEELTICECNEMLNRWPEDEENSNNLILSKLKRINLQKITVLKPHVFDFLFDMAPNLTALEISLCFKKCVDSVLIKKMVEHSILSLVRKKHQIKSLFFHGTPIDDLDLMKLVSIDGLQLEQLSITFTGRLLNPAMLDAARRAGLRNKKIVDLGWILEFLKTHENMVYLDLSESLNLLDYCLSIICKNMPNLKELRLRRCVMISDFGIKELNQLKNLEVLDITGCEKITDKGIQEGVVGSTWENWKEKMNQLSIGSNTKYTEHTIGFIATMFLGLTALDVSCSPNCMTDHSLQLIIKHLRMLRSLNITGCGQITDAGMTGVGIDDNPWRSNSISQLKGLKSLQLSGVYQITDESLMRINFLELKELSLAHCQMITEDGVFVFVQQCPSLEVLDLTDCHNINDACVDAITNRLRRLRSFSIACCNQITDRSVDSIVTNCEELKILHIRGCNRISSDALKRFHKLTWLKHIYSN